MESCEYDIKKMLEISQKIWEKLCELSGTESVMREETKSSLKICSDMLQEIRVTTTVMRGEMQAYFIDMYDMHGKRSALSASAAAILYHDFIRDMLLHEKIGIFDIPFQIRTATNSFYATACRVCRYQGLAEYRTVLDLLKDDLLLVNETDKTRLSKLYSDLKENARFVDLTEQGNSDSI